MTAALIDRIYECSFVPEFWPDVLDELALLTGARGGLLFAVRDRVLSWTSSDKLNPVFQSYVSDGWFSKCSRRICLFGRNEPRFLGEHDFWTDDQIDANPIYRDFFRPHGLGWSAGTGIAAPTGDNIVFSVERDFALGPIEQPLINRLDELRPHLARSAFVSARLGLQRAKGGSDTLALLGLPALVLDDAGRVLEANRLIEELKDHVQWAAMGGVTLSDALADGMLKSRLAGLEAEGGPGIQSFPVRDAGGRAAMVVHLIPIRGSAHDIFDRSHALMVMTPVSAPRAPSVELLRSLFDLTASEARVARGLATGGSLSAIAADGGVGINTVRSQLQQVLDKTGCARQAEVVALLSNVTIEH